MGWARRCERAVALYRNVAEAARSYGIKAERVDGMDVLAVRAVMRTVVDAGARGPRTLFHRGDDLPFMGHSMSDPSHGHYDTKEEVEEHRKRDPLLLLKQTMLDKKLAVETDFKQLERSVSKSVAAAVKFADESPFPDPSTLHTDVMAVQE